MGIAEQANLHNLFSLYRLLGSTCESTPLYSFSGFDVIQGKDSVWPGMAFGIDEASLHEELIDNIANEMKALGLRPTMILNSGRAPLNSLKAKGFLPIDQWLGMHYEGIMTVVNTGYVSENAYLLGDSNDIGPWTETVSQTLFGSRTIDPGIFEALQFNGAELIGIKVENELAGSSMIYFDENGRAGIYMVGVKGKYRGKGLGKELIRYCISRIQKKGIDVCYLQATRMAIDLYYSLGFKASDNYLIVCKIK